MLPLRACLTASGTVGHTDTRPRQEALTGAYRAGFQTVGGRLTLRFTRSDSMLHLYYKRTLQGDSYMVVIVGIIVAYIIFVLLIAKFCDINTYPKEDDNNTSV